MAQLVIDCPHCDTKTTSMVTHGYFYVGMVSGDVRRGVNVYSTCPHCLRPIGCLMAAKNRWSSAYEFQQHCDDIFDSEDARSVASEGFELLEIYPSPADPVVPDHLPEPAAKAFRAGEATFANPDTAEVSAMSYRRSVEMAIRSRRPELKGTLAKRIESLKADGSIPVVLADWAHEVRAIGNDGAHELDDMKPGDLQAIRGFAEAFLRYFITLPHELDQRRAAVTVAAVADE